MHAIELDLIPVLCGPLDPRRDALHPLAAISLQPGLELGPIRHRVQPKGMCGLVVRYWRGQQGLVLWGTGRRGKGACVQCMQISVWGARKDIGCERETENGLGGPHASPELKSLASHTITPSLPAAAQTTIPTCLWGMAGLPSGRSGKNSSHTPKEFFTAQWLSAGFHSLYSPIRHRACTSAAGKG